MFAWEKYSLSTEQINTIWAASRQNQQNDCAPSEDSEQPGHPPSLVRVLVVRMKKAWVLSYPSKVVRRLIRLPSLIWVFAGCICHFVGFLMGWLILWICFKTTLYSPLIMPRKITFYVVICRRTRKIELYNKMHRLSPIERQKHAETKFPDFSMTFPWPNSVFH